MAVTPGNLKFDVADENLSDLKAIDECSIYIANTGWKGTGLCNGGSTNQIRIGLENFPLPQNTRVIGATIYGSASGVNATTHIGFGPSGDSADYNDTIVGIDTGQYSHTWQEAITDYGQPLSFIAGVNYDTRGPSTIYITGIVFDTLVDDSLPQGLPGDNNPPPPAPDCIDTITYSAGSGPDCVLEAQEYEFKTSGDRILNVLDFTLFHATDFVMTGYVNWTIGAVTNANLIYTEAPLGTLYQQIPSNGAQDPVAANLPIIGKRIKIYAPPFSGVATIKLRVTKIESGDSVDIIPGGGNYGDIFSGLNGIVEAINDEKLKLDDTIHTGLFDLKSIIANLSGDLPSGLVGALTSAFTGVPQSLINPILQNLQIPAALVQDLLDFIHTILTSESEVIQTSLQALGLSAQDYLASHVDSQNNNFGGALSAQEKVVNDLLNGKYSDADNFFSDLRNAGNNIALIEWLQNAYLIVFGTIGFLKAKTNIADIVTNQILLGQYTPNINDLSTLVTDYFKGAISLTELQDYAKRYGLDISKVTELVSARRPLPNLQEIREGFVRGFITQAQHDKYLQMHGFGSDDIAYLKTLYNVQLGPSDVTRIADKHIYSNDIPTIFGQYTEIDQGYLDAMSKLGINADQTNKLWAAHWSLTGLQDTFSMYHRGLLTDSELNTWFALTDIMPFFREKLKQLNYALVTRVDIRRFYAEGLYNEAQVTQAYKKLGFSETDAQLQTQYTVLHERDSENPTKVKIKTLTESMVIKAYKRGIIDQNQAITRLTQVGYLANDAQLVLRLETQIDSTSIIADKTQHYHDKLFNHILASLSKGTIGEDEARSLLSVIGVPQAEIESEIAYSAIERVLELKQFVEDHIRTAYTSGQIDKTSASNLMADIGFNINEINYLFEEFDLVKQLRNKQLTETQLKDIYTAGVIDRNTLYTELQGLGYSDKHAQWLTNTIAPIGG